MREVSIEIVIRKQAETHNYSTAELQFSFQVMYVPKKEPLKEVPLGAKVSAAPLPPHEFHANPWGGTPTFRHPQGDAQAAEMCAAQLPQQEFRANP